MLTVKDHLDIAIISDQVSNERKLRAAAELYARHAEPKTTLEGVMAMAMDEFVKALPGFYASLTDKAQSGASALEKLKMH